MFESLLNPPALANYSDYFQTLLSTSGVLFGLAFTALLFVIESGFASFKFSRRMFLEVYVKFGQNLLVSLAYLTLLSLGQLYFSEQTWLLSFAYYCFAVTFAKTLLDYFRQLGYIYTLFSTARVPRSYGPLRQYFRYIWNLGLPTTIGIIVVLLTVLVYPIYISSLDAVLFQISQKGFFYSTAFILFYSVLRITSFIPQFFNYSNLELDYKSNDSDDEKEEASDINYTTEKLALRKFLEARGLKELDPASSIPFLDGTLSLSFVEDREGAEAWFNIFVGTTDSNNVEIRNAVCRYATNLFKLLSTSKVDINSFVLSFHINIAGDEKHRRNVFFRTNRLELGKVLSSNKNPVEASLMIKDKQFDGLFRDL